LYLIVLTAIAVFHDNKNIDSTRLMAHFPSHMISCKMEFSQIAARIQMAHFPIHMILFKMEFSQIGTRIQITQD
jgi:hypothetical protein